MEPRSIERGKANSLSRSFVGILLQWSRDQLNAESLRLLVMIRNGNGASMEPRSIERGKYSLVSGTGQVRWLQWSRDQLNAERVFERGRRKPRQGFNGAAIN